MRKRVIISALVMATLLLLGFFSPHFYWLIRGTVAAEAFYSGKPTSYWRGIAQLNTPTQSELTWHDNFRWQTWTQRMRDADARQWERLLTDDAAVPVLRELFHDKDVAVRDNAVIALCEHREAVRNDLPLLIDYARKDGRQAEMVVLMLALRGGPEMLPALCDLSEESESLAKYAANAFGLYAQCGYQSECEEMLPQLLRTLDRETGKRSACMFRVIGEKAIPALAERLHSDNVTVRRNATRALARMAVRPEALALVLRQFEDPDPQVRRIAVGMLRPYEAAPDVLIAVLRAYNDDPDVTVQAAALAMLGGEPRYFGVGTDRQKFEAMLKWAENEKQDEVYYEAVRSLDKYLRSDQYLSPPPPPVPYRIHGGVGPASSSI